MEFFKVLGYRDVEFTDQKTGKVVSGISLYVSREDDNVCGVMTDKIFIGRQRLEECHYVPVVGDTIRVTYNKYGKPADVSAA